MSFRQLGSAAPRVGLGIVDIDPILIELHAIVMELAAYHIDLSFEHNRGELITGDGQGSCCILPLRRALRPLLQIEDPVVGSIGVAIRFEPTDTIADEKRCAFPCAERSIK